MSNVDGGCIYQGFEEALREGKFGKHAGWNFNGIVWFEDNLFHEEVCVYHEVQEVISSDTLKELMKVVNDKYGWD
jgi:hypothetical protein